ncbi:MAG: 7-cyano-7-deazaguanine synthase QueC [Candidatus Omnitrophica bacterium]|nr:7-cyano-7-deazaguanine synthase QueC [Candidatus Omnitrophota bacterium]MBU4345744.1 7-cyano-7-deazaguanine synthase QueC [Candidatus Omnitrophota bacterium]MBU4472750.1 7-cyano-7-deazaguanine synthase QueC [Candidatus Omnitrophota bacterium]
MRKAVVLLSGGLDSATTLYIARSQGFRCFCLIFDYGQRHRREIKAAQRIAQIANCKLQIVKIALPWKGSSLLDKKINIPLRVKGIPSTYVPARNIIFLSFALSYAETINARAIFIGANALDFSGYPDCRPEFYRAFRKIIDSGTKSGAKGKKIQILTPLIKKKKAQIIKTGVRLGVPFEFTWSCYRGGIRPCEKCDSCYFRAKGFREAGIKDPLLAERQGDCSCKKI